MKKLIIFLLSAIMVLSLTACGNSENDSIVPGDLASGENEGTSAQGGAAKADDNYTFDIKEDDHTVVITVANTIQVYTHDGVKVTGYTTYVDAGDAETAAVVAKSINVNDSYYKGMGMKSVKTKGKYVVQDYSEEGFPCKTYEELHNLAEQAKQIR